jgi:hypothetical protein
MRLPRWHDLVNRLRCGRAALTASLALAGAIATVPVHAQQRGVARPAPAARDTIHGRVLDERGRPIHSATVRVQRAQRQPTGGVITDRDGRFALPVAPRSALALQVSRRGYGTLVLDVAATDAARDSVDVILFPSDDADGAAIMAARDSITSPSRASTAAAGDDNTAVGHGAPRADSGSARPTAPSTSASSATASGATAPRPRQRTVTGRGIVGRVTDANGTALANAIVNELTQRREARTDAAGRFVMADVRPGAALVRVRRLGFLPVTFPVTLGEQGAVEVEVALDAAGQDLGRVSVRADAQRSARLRGFEERRAGGTVGQFRTRDQFLLRGPVRASDLLTDFAGVVTLPDASGKRIAYGRGRCLLPIFLDGTKLPLGGGTALDDVLSVNDVAAVEVYTSLAGLPPEFLGRTDNCGAVLLWTRSGTERP